MPPTLHAVETADDGGTSPRRERLVDALDGCNVRSVATCPRPGYGRSRSVDVRSVAETTTLWATLAGLELDHPTTAE